MAAAATPALPYRGSWDERFLYYSAGLISVVHLLIIGTNQIISGMIPLNSICGNTSILHWEYWSIFGQAGLTILALGFFYSLLWHTLWRWWYVPALFTTFGCFGLHLFCTIWYIQYEASCPSYAQCWGTCSGPSPPGPSSGASPPGPSGYWISWWTLTGVLTLLCLLEGLDIIAIGRFTAVQALLLWTYGSNVGPWNYYERSADSWRSPYGVPYNAPQASQLPDAKPLLGSSKPSGAHHPEAAVLHSDLEHEFQLAATRPAGATVVGGTFIFPN